MVDSVFVPFNTPFERVAGRRSREAKTVLDPRFDFRSFLVIVPSDQLHGLELLSGAVQAVCIRESLQPRLSALLAHDPIRAPGCQCVVESFVGGTHRLFIRQRHASLIEARQVTHPVVGRGRHHPRVAAVA